MKTTQLSSDSSNMWNYIWKIWNNDFSYNKTDMNERKWSQLVIAHREKHTPLEGVDRSKTEGIKTVDDEGVITLKVATTLKLSLELAL